MSVAIDLTKTVKEIITTMKTVIDDIQDNYQTKTDIADTYESQTDASTAHTALQNSIAAKQDKLTFDNTPTDNSSNPVTSSGIKAALDEKLNVSGNDTATGTMTFQKKIVLQDGATSTGAFVIDPNTINYNEDLRLNESTKKWATIYMGAPLKSMQGRYDNAWGISRIPSGQLDFFKGASGTTLNTGLRLNGDGTALLGGKEVVKNTGTWDIGINGNSATASKLQTPCTISLTGNAMGSANFDGSGNISINTTVYALNIGTHRPADANVQYGDGKIRYFLATSSMASNKPMKDAAILHLAWDNNGGFDSQLAITNAYAELQTRSQKSGTWGNWKTFLNEENYTNYAPTKDGVGATGTWNINISGTATKATQDANGNNIASTYATKSELNSKQAKLTFDSTPTANSSNPVTSAGIKAAIDAKTVDLSNYYTKAQVDSAISTAISGIVDGDSKSY